ncbi:DNA ligase-like domain-containing protein [Streptomyces cinereoruber]|uniref:hypothetical protein n=1 Tax=Streptomyces cinereoruber TaxID=67260 RepID=UPI003638C461
MDLALVGMMLRPGTVLDDEITIWHDGRIDFAAVQARAASGIDRSRILAARPPPPTRCGTPARCRSHPVLADHLVRRRPAFMTWVSQILDAGTLPWSFKIGRTAP